MAFKKFNPVARAVAVMSAVAISVTGVTYAALQSTATLSQNTISVADSNLLIWDAQANAFETEAPGFAITNLIPGEGSGFNKFYLQNQSDGPLHVYAHVPEAPAAPEGGYGFTGWENLTVTFYGYICSQTVETDMAELMAGNVAMPCNPLPEDAQGNANAGAESTAGNYAVEFDIKPESLTEGSEDAGVGAFDIDFIGSLVQETEEVPAP